MKRAAIMIAVSFAIGACVGIAVYRWEKARAWALYAIGNIPYSEMREQLIDAFSVPASIIVIGDSVSEYINWHAALNRPDVVVHAFAGNTAARASARAREAIGSGASTALVMLGINDIIAGYDPTPDYIRLIRALHAVDMRVVVSATVGDAKHKLATERLNTALQRECADDTCTFIDLTTLLAPNGVLAPQYTIDGIHLNASAYVIWVDALRHRIDN